MTPELWQEVKKVLAGALELKPEERTVYLDQVCAEPTLRREVESLIDAHEEGDAHFMDPPAFPADPLESGGRVGSYTILSRIGSGGMGEVYKAHDTKLNRDVAIKVLPHAFVHDPERLARFRREARLLASLNHPNIAAIHGLEDSEKNNALVMELVEGTTLADRIRLGPIPMEETLPIARQMTEALEYAHEHGVIHRDLKPANVKVASDDTVKILDFGLAKAMETDVSAANFSDSPTISQMATEAGVLLGTTSYMAPEQAKGKPVDRRADIWAFGCVLYEMLTRKMAFHGDTVTDRLAAVLKNEPDWSQLPAATPMRVRVLLQRCLQKDPKQRLRDIGDARISLEEVLSGAPEGPPLTTEGQLTKRWQPWLAWGIASVFALGMGLLAFLHPGQKPRSGPPMRFEISLPDKVSVGGGLALSPDGRKLAFLGSGPEGQNRVWVRSFETVEAHPLEGTEGASGLPFWSPDSRFIAFATPGKLKKIDSSGGRPLTLCDAPLTFGGSWSGNKIVFGTANGILQISASGGKPSPIGAGGLLATPSFLPDGRHFLYLRSSEQSGRGVGIYLGSVATEAKEQSSKRLLPDYSMVVYTPSHDPDIGYLLFVRGATAPGATGTLMAQPFDPQRLELAGDAVPIAEKVGNATFSASGTDLLVFSTGPQTVSGSGAAASIRRPGQLAWFDRQGKVVRRIGDTGFYLTLGLSPDGKRVAFERADPQSQGNRNIWLYEFARGVATRLTFNSGWDSSPVWSPDGSRIAFGSNRSSVFDLYEKASTLVGEEKLIFKSGESKVPRSWSPDGRFLLYQNIFPPMHMWLLFLDDVVDRKPVPLEHSEFNQTGGRFSPDGRWIAYSSDESGRNEIYVRSFDESFATGSSSAEGTTIRGKWMVSKDGGNSPLWSHDGKELFYLTPDGMAMAVEVNATGAFRAGVPKALFKVPPGVRFWDVSADGKRFLMVASSGGNTAAQSKFNVVLNWQSGLKK